MTTVTKGSTYTPTLMVGDWHQSFVLAAKQSYSTGEQIKPLSKVYTRTREVFKHGQRLVETQYMTPEEYTMMLLKHEYSQNNG